MKTPCKTGTSAAIPTLCLSPPGAVYRFPYTPKNIKALADKCIESLGEVVVANATLSFHPRAWDNQRQISIPVFAAVWCWLSSKKQKPKDKKQMESDKNNLVSMGGTCVQWQHQLQEESAPFVTSQQGYFWTLLSLSSLWLWLLLL